MDGAFEVFSGELERTMSLDMSSSIPLYKTFIHDSPDLYCLICNFCLHQARPWFFPLHQGLQNTLGVLPGASAAEWSVTSIYNFHLWGSS